MLRTPIPIPMGVLQVRIILNLFLKDTSYLPSRYNFLVLKKYLVIIIYEYFISIFSILNLCLLKHIINIQYPSEVISGLSHPQNKIFAKDSNIQRNRKFGYGRECFAPPSPYLWGCSKYYLNYNIRFVYILSKYLKYFF